MLGTTPKEKEPAATSGKVKVAVVQAAPVAFNRERTLEKVHTLAGEAASKGARLALFPEAFVSAYPRGLDFGAVVGSRSEKGREDFRRYWESSVDVPGPAVDELARAARSNCIYLVVGVVERDRGTLGSLRCGTSPSRGGASCFRATNSTVGATFLLSIIRPLEKIRMHSFAAVAVVLSIPSAIFLPDPTRTAKLFWSPRSIAPRSSEASTTWMLWATMPGRISFNSTSTSSRINL